MSPSSTNAPRRILYLQSTSEIGGSDISLLRIIEKLDRARFQPCVVLPHDGPLVESLRKLGADVFIEPAMLKLTTRRGGLYIIRYALNWPRAVCKLRALILREKIDLVHTNTLHNLYGFAAARLAHRPHFWHIREIVMQSGLVKSVELFLARRYSTRIIVTSDAVGAMFRDDAGNYPSHLRKIPNSIDTELYHPRNDGRRIRNDVKLSMETPLIGLVCRLDQWKGVDTFLQAAKICHDQFPSVRFAVVGGPIVGQESYADELKSLSKTLGLYAIVHFTDWRYHPEDMPAVHAALDILVLASRWPEPFGLVLLEAMATAKPIVATNHGGPTEICVDGQTALLVPPENPEKMAEAILTLLRDPDRARAMGNAGRTRVEQLYDRNVCLEKLAAVYDEVLAG